MGSGAYVVWVIRHIQLCIIVWRYSGTGVPLAPCIGASGLCRHDELVFLCDQFGEGSILYGVEFVHPNHNIPIIMAGTGNPVGRLWWPMVKPEPVGQAVLSYQPRGFVLHGGKAHD